MNQDRFNKKSMYDLWMKMIDRCYNEKNISYKYYGAKGILVCDRWRESFETFCIDMGIRPKGTSIDRIDGLGNYGHSNCRWATITEQNRNKSDTRNITFNGETKTMTAWAKEIGTSPATLHYRLTKSKLSIEKALTIPVSRSNTKNKEFQQEIK